MKDNKEKLHQIILRMPTFIEKIIAIFLLIGVVYGTGKVVLAALDMGSAPLSQYMENLLDTAFSVIIVIELIRMLIKHSMNTVIEVLIFAIARGLVACHPTPVNSLISIIGIAILLGCRKFLFHEFDFEEEI